MQQDSYNLKEYFKIYMIDLFQVSVLISCFVEDMYCKTALVQLLVFFQHIVTFFFEKEIKRAWEIGQTISLVIDVTKLEQPFKIYLLLLQISRIAYGIFRFLKPISEQRKKKSFCCIYATLKKLSDTAHFLYY